MRSVCQLDTVPAHLRRYVVAQDYEQYTEMDQAVWRFVLLQTYARLQHTAHASYRTGLAATGIAVDEIPRIEAMQDKLARFGWSAVCVDGFIPPRAFQGFQANRILPIAAAIRSCEHLAYTPAPDIIHEAAGHAPILSEPGYAEFIQRFGATAEKAFAAPSDRDVHQAVHLLSELKEDPASTAEQLRAATHALQSALARASGVSESARLARLYWWTAEYGLIGSVDDFKLYGAGLLSSLLESQSCLRPSVKKLPLSSACLEVDYDITRAQPQLFVARDFEQLLQVLDEVSASLSFRRPPAEALATAHKSEEVATLSFDSGLQLAGVVSAWDELAPSPAWLQLSGTPRLFDRAARVDAALLPNDYVLVQGRLRDGATLSELSRAELERYVHAGVLTLAFASGMKVSARLRDAHVADGRVVWALLERFELTLTNGQVFRARALYPLLFGTLVRVSAGAPDLYFGDEAAPPLRMPRPRWFGARERGLLSLYEQAVESWKQLAGSQLVLAFERITRELDREHPDDWLLRWNLLESLLKVGEEGALAQRLTHDLELLEIKYQAQAPIATGLAHLRALTREVPAPAR